MKSQTIEELRPLVTHIKDIYTGDYASVSRELHKAITYLNFLEENTIHKAEVQDTIFALHKLAECFFAAHRKRKQYQHQVIDKVIEELQHVDL